MRRDREDFLSVKAVSRQVKTARERCNCRYSNGTVGKFPSRKMIAICYGIAPYDSFNHSFIVSAVVTTT